MIRFIAALAAACIATAAPAHAQADGAAESYSALAFDFCTPALSLGANTIETAAAEKGFALGPWRTASDAGDRFEQWVRETMGVSPQTRIRFVVAGEVAEAGPVVMAAVDEAASACMVTARRAEYVGARLLRTLGDPASEWQREMTTEDGRASIFVRPGPAEGASVTLFQWPARPNEVDQVLLQRREIKAAPRVSEDVRRQWVNHVLDRCAAGVHENRQLAAEDFAPFLVFEKISEQGRPTLKSAPGQPAATIFLNGPESICLITAAGEHARLLDESIRAVAAARGFQPSQRPRRLRMPKFLIPRSAGQREGDDAFVATSEIMGILFASVGSVGR